MSCLLCFAIGLTLNWNLCRRKVYPCKVNGTSGRIIITPWSADGESTIAFERASIGNSVDFIRDLNDIVEVKKVGVSVPRTVLGWVSGADIQSQTMIVRMKSLEERAASERQGTKEIKGLNSYEGDIYVLSAIGRRDQLFCRLISIGNQRWESM